MTDLNSFACLGRHCSPAAYTIYRQSVSAVCVCVLGLILYLRVYLFTRQSTVRTCYGWPMCRLICPAVRVRGERGGGTGSLLFWPGHPALQWAVTGICHEDLLWPQPWAMDMHRDWQWPAMRQAQSLLPFLAFICTRTSHGDAGDGHGM